MKTNYIKSPSESDHWLTKAEQRRQIVNALKAVVWIGLAIFMYYWFVEMAVGPMV